VQQSLVMLDVRHDGRDGPLEDARVSASTTTVAMDVPKWTEGYFYGSTTCAEDTQSHEVVRSCQCSVRLRSQIDTQ
jgi:hypothetical protein